MAQKNKIRKISVREFAIIPLSSVEPDRVPVDVMSPDTNTLISLRDGADIDADLRYCSYLYGHPHHRSLGDKSTPL